MFGHAWHEGRISIHALRKESDLAETSKCSPFPISIHALRKESDQALLDGQPKKNDFNPRSP